MDDKPLETQLRTLLQLNDELRLANAQLTRQLESLGAPSGRPAESSSTAKLQQELCALRADYASLAAATVVLTADRDKWRNHAAELGRLTSV